MKFFCFKFLKIYIFVKVNFMKIKRAKLVLVNVFGTTLNVPVLV